jgi:hypothetical protein
MEVGAVSVIVVEVIAIDVLAHVNVSEVLFDAPVIETPDE